MHRHSQKLGTTLLFFLGMCAGETRAQGRVAWRFDAGAPVRCTPVIGSEGEVYFGTDRGDVYALDGRSRPLWSFRTEGRVRSAPALGPDGTLYVSSGDGHLYAIGSEGGFRWRFRTGGGGENAPAVGAGGTVFAGPDGGQLRAISRGGRLLWTVHTGPWVPGRSRIGPGGPRVGPDGTVYVGTDSGLVLALTAGGNLLWRYQTQGEVRGAPVPGARGRLLFGSQDGRLHAVDAGGASLWQYATGGWVLGSVAVDPDGTTYAGSSNGVLHAVDPDGERLWEVTLGRGFCSTPVLDHKGTIYVRVDGKLHAIDTSGRKLEGELALPGEVWSSPALARDGRLYVGSDSGHLYAVDTEAGFEGAPRLSLTLSFADRGGDGVLDAGESATLTVTLRNEGRGPARMLRFSLSSSGPAISLGPAPRRDEALEAGDAWVFSLPVKVRSEQPDGELQICVEATEGSGFDHSSCIGVATRRKRPPRLSLAGVRVDDDREAPSDGDGDGLIERGEAVEIEAVLHNSGAGGAVIGAAGVRSRHDHVRVAELHSDFGTFSLGPGESSVFRFVLVVAPRHASAPELPVELVLEEGGVERRLPLGLVLGPRQPAPVEDNARGADPLPDVDAPSRGHGAMDPHAYAIVVGLEEHAELEGSAFALRDATAVAAYLEYLLRVPRSRIVVLTDREATGGRLRLEIGKRLRARAREGRISRLFFFFAGRGAFLSVRRAGTSYLSRQLVPSDGDPRRPGSLLRLSELLDLLAFARAEQTHVWLDAAFGGRGARSVDTGAQGIPLDQAPAPGACFIEAAPAGGGADLPGLFVLEAARGDQAANELEERRHGLFTYYLLRGLRGEADENVDRTVTFTELCEYLAREVSAAAWRRGAKQAPRCSPKGSSRRDPEIAWLR